MDLSPQTLSAKNTVECQGQRKDVASIRSQVQGVACGVGY